MRRAIATVLTVPTLLLAACGDGDDGGATPPTSSTSIETAATAEPTSGDEATETAEDAASTEGSTGDASTSTAPGTAGAPTSVGEVEGGEDGQAAADVAKAFFVASVQAAPEACDHLLSFTDPSVPMADVEADMELCREVLPAAMSAEVDAQQLGTEEQAQILEAMQIRGAEVDGDSAVVDKDNLSELFQDVLGDEVITLRKIDGTWYVDLDRSFQTTAP